MVDDADAVHVERLRAIAMVLPEATEVDLLGTRTFRVTTKPFAAFERVGGVPVVRVKLDPDEQGRLVAEPGFEPAPDTGHHGWTNVRLDGDVAWSEIDRLVVESYRQQAPKGLRLLLDELLEAAGEQPLEEDDAGEVDLTPESVGPRVVQIVTVPGAEVEAVMEAEQRWRAATEGRRARSRLAVAEQSSPPEIVLVIEHVSATDAAADAALAETAELLTALGSLAEAPIEVRTLELRRSDLR